MEITIPKPLTIGPELTQIYLSGIFGIFREAEFVIDAKQNKIKISNACLGFSENVLPGTIICLPSVVLTWLEYLLLFSRG